ncbi:hypothetical protein [Helicobacter sp. 11S03491-1]|uniref:hypothetical protein n=1 Tax=Helicobacter sp. 11S03491-1 TaxID=1476196 RepID=UPI000BA637E4|nr:hypothetical protein [Helicobacter sp. 11S03491-1]PAF41716.1 hypothetical protein BKH45_06415 [Helicobacter sp. 11S03491-1]
MIKNLVGLIVGIILVGEAYDMQTWKSNPPQLLPNAFLDLPLINNMPEGTEPFNPPFLPSHQTHQSFFLKPLAGILPQVIPEQLPLPDPLMPDIVSIPKKKEFLISYQLYVKNGIAQGERYSISKPIKSRVKSGRYVFDYQCRIDTYIGDFIGDDSMDEAPEIILRAKKDAVLECLYKSGVKIRDDGLMSDSQMMSKSMLTLPARAVEAYLDNSFLILEVWKEKK